MPSGPGCHVCPELICEILGQPCEIRAMTLVKLLKLENGVPRREYDQIRIHELGNAICNHIGYIGNRLECQGFEHCRCLVLRGKLGYWPLAPIIPVIGVYRTIAPNLGCSYLGLGLPKSCGRIPTQRNCTLKCRQSKAPLSLSKFLFWCFRWREPQLDPLARWVDGWQNFWTDLLTREV